MSIFIIIFIILYSTSFAYLPNILDRKTKPKEDKGWFLETKYNILFCLVNIFCFFFLDKIREHRKTDWYKDRILMYDQNFVRMLGFESLSSKSKSEYLKMKRYLKIKKLNDKS